MGSGTRRTCMYPLLRKLMGLRDCTMEELAAHLGISYSSLRRKITGYQPWRLEEAVAIMHYLDLPMAKIELTFTPRSGRKPDTGASEALHGAPKCAPCTASARGSASQGAVTWLARQPCRSPAGRRADERGGSRFSGAPCGGGSAPWNQEPDN